jgi:hypothetical protein
MRLMEAYEMTYSLTNWKFNPVEDQPPCGGSPEIPAHMSALESTCYQSHNGAIHLAQTSEPHNFGGSSNEVALIALGSCSRYLLTWQRHQLVAILNTWKKGAVSFAS